MFSRLARAAKRGDLAGARAAVRGGDDPTWTSDLVGSHLSEASSRGHLAVVRYLHSLGADPNVRCFLGAPVERAARGGHLSVVRWLVAFPEVALRDEALCAAIRAGSLPIVALLAPRLGLHPRSTWTPLHLACRCDNLEIAHWLHARGADPDRRDGDGGTPLFEAGLRVLPWLTGLPIDLGARNNRGETALHAACSRRRVEEARFLAALPGVDIEARDARGDTPFIVACKRRDARIARILIEAGADVLAWGASGRDARYAMRRRRRRRKATCTAMIAYCEWEGGRRKLGALLRELPLPLGARHAVLHLLIGDAPRLSTLESPGERTSHPARTPA